MTHSKFCPEDCGTPTRLQVFRDSSLEAHTALGTEEMGLQQPHSAGVRPRDGSRRGCHGSAFLWGGQLGSETQAASPPCRLSIRSTQPPVSQVGLLRLRAGKAWTLMPAPPQCPQGQPPPDATGRLGCPLPSCPTPQNGLTLPSLFHVRPLPLPGCPPRQHRPGLRHYLPAQRGPCSLQKRRALDIHHTCRPDRLGMPASSWPPSASAVCLDGQKAGQALDQQAASWGGGRTWGQPSPEAPLLAPSPGPQPGRTHCADSQGQGTMAH